MKNKPFYMSSSRVLEMAKIGLSENLTNLPSFIFAKISWREKYPMYGISSPKFSVVSQWNVGMTTEIFQNIDYSRKEISQILKVWPLVCKVFLEACYLLEKFSVLWLLVVSCFSHTATWKQKIPNLWNRSGQTQVRTLNSLLLKPRALPPPSPPLSVFWL